MSVQEDVREISQRLNALGGEQPEMETLVMAGCFILCWGKFESICLPTIGQARPDQDPARYQDSIGHFCAESIQDDTDFTRFEPSFEHFRRRYRGPIKFTDHFTFLIGNDARAGNVIDDILEREPNSTREKVEALLLIAYRLRGNLVHGLKWTSGLQDQVDNFTHASRVLLGAIEQFR